MAASQNARAAVTAVELSRRWTELRDRFLPITIPDSFWRASRHTRLEEPAQGWKLHISATVLQACDLFERVAPFLAKRDVCFKAPHSLTDLMELNAGATGAYWQVGKFLTIYPSADEDAVALASELHELTRDFVSISVPFDNRYLPGSNVFYRYGGFGDLKVTDENGVELPAVENDRGELVYDDRLVAVPTWMSDPFLQATENPAIENKNPSPLKTTYHVFEALTQRGKGGTYRAVDMGATPPRFCVVKEGRRHGEVDWSGRDGRDLIEHEHRNLLELGKRCDISPRVYDSFEADGNFYMVLEYTEGTNLQALMMKRRRRFSIKQVIRIALDATRLLESINRAGWIWNDCKPSNLIVDNQGTLRAIDFENAYPVDGSARFDWGTPWYSDASANRDDRYALGAVMYVLLTGRFYDAQNPVPIRDLRRNVPTRLQAIVDDLLSQRGISIEALRLELESMSY